MKVETFIKKENISKVPLKEVLEMSVKNFKAIMNGFKKAKLINYGNIVECEGYFHETDERYPLVGIILEYETEYTGSFNDATSEFGLFPLWVNKPSKYVPISFDEASGFNDHRIGNGCGDYASIIKTMISREEIMKEVVKMPT